MIKKVLTVLLIEDEHADALLFRELLQEVDADAVVYHVENGHSALRFLHQQDEYSEFPRPDLIVLDLNMPVMSGHEFLTLAKTHEGLCDVPVLVLSTSENPNDVTISYRRHASGYMVKPGTYLEYMRILNVLLAYWKGIMLLPRIAELKL